MHEGAGVFSMVAITNLKTSGTAANPYRDAVLVALISFGLLIALEIAARLYQRFAAPQEHREQISLPVLMRQEWGPQYLQDTRKYRWVTTFQPYVDFRHRPFESETINIGKDGVRLTPGSCMDRAASLEVFMFGGSTMIGMGVPDQYTIPAYLARALNKGDACVKVVNYGTTWWQSSQSLAQLANLLRAGERPDVVIFYDGINDINVLTFGGHAGGIAPRSEELLAHGMHSDSHPVRELLGKYSALYRLVSRLVGPRIDKDELNDFSMTEAEIPVQAEPIASIYVHNIRMLRALEAQYGFRALAVLQPFPLVVKKPLQAEEKEVLARRLKVRPWEPPMISAVYDLVRTDKTLARDSRFVDLSAVLDGVDELLFVDGEHLLPRGNEIVALKLASLLNDTASLGREAVLARSNARLETGKESSQGSRSNYQRKQ